MTTVTAHVQGDRLLLSLPIDALPPEQALDLLELFLAIQPQDREACLQALELRAGSPDAALPLPVDENRYIDLIQRRLQERDQQAIRFAEADLFALSEAERLGIRLTARQRNTLIQYYVERQADDDTLQPTGGSSREAALARARILADRIRIRR
jgi:hypothetical protein